MTVSSPQPSPSPCYQEPPDRKPSHPASPWAVAGLAGRMPRWAGKEGGRFRSDGRGLVSVLERPAGPGGEGGGGVGTPRVVSVDPGLLGTSGKPGSSIPEVPSGSSRAAGSPRTALQPLLCLPLEWSLARAWPRERQGLCRPPGTCWPRPESRTQRLPPALVQLRPPVVFEARQQGAL